MLSDLQKRCVELSFRHKLSHVSSVLNCVDVLADIYAKRKDDDPVVLANCHASLALYVVLESLGKCDAEEMIRDHGVHCHRDMPRGIWVSGGSLGQAETVAVGLALSDRNRTVWLVTSDGACMEGAVFEAMRISNKLCPNLRWHIIFNGFGAYGEIRLFDLPRWPASTTFHTVGGDYPEFLQGLRGHYLILKKPNMKN